MRGRVIILLALIIIAAVVAAGALFLAGGEETDGDGGGAAATEPAETEEPNMVFNEEGTPIGTATPTPEIITAPVVIAQQDLPRGFRLTEEFLSGPSPAVGIAFWPVDNIPQNSYSAVEDLEGLLIRSDVPRESPILSTQLVADMTALGDVGSDAALLLNPGQVAISLPLSPTGIGSVAYGIQPGDELDVILSFLFIEVDETFQTRQPNLISVITRTEDGQLEFGGQLEGRPEPSTLSSLGVLVSPSERQRPRLVTQRTVERAEVIHVGYFPPDGRIVGVMTPTPFDTPTVDPNLEPAQQTQVAQQQQAAAVQATPTEFQPVIITLGVDPQDALVLTWALDAQVPVTFALRSATDTGSTPTTAVTLQYLIENYSIPQPPVLPFALEPPIRSLRSVELDVFREFSVESGQGAQNSGEGGQQ